MSKYNNNKYVIDTFLNTLEKIDDKTHEGIITITFHKNIDGIEIISKGHGPKGLCGYVSYTLQSFGAYVGLEDEFMKLDKENGLTALKVAWNTLGFGVGVLKFIEESFLQLERLFPEYIRVKKKED